MGTVKVAADEVADPAVTAVWYPANEGRGVEMIQEPNEVPWGIDAAFRDLSGNQIRFVQIIP